MLSVRYAALALATLALATLALTARADGYVYWSAVSDLGQGTPAIGRAGLAGQNPNQTFITGGNWGGNGNVGPYGLAVDRAPEEGTAKFLYWTNLRSATGGPNSSSIVRAPSDGTGFPQTLLFEPGFAPLDVAVGGGFIYWNITPQSDRGVPGSIGRAFSLHGDDPSENFVSPLQETFGIAIDDTYIYFTDQVPQQGGGTVSTIGRAKLDGTGIDERWLVADAGEGWWDVAVEDKFIYWTATGTGGASGPGTIGRARLRGKGKPTAVNEDYISGATNPYAVAVDDAHIYWSNFYSESGSATIGSANLNGSNVQQDLISLPSGVSIRALALDAGPYACAGEDATVAGTGRSDTLRASNDDDVIAARGADDTVSARGGDDLVCGAGSADTLTGGGGDDELLGGGGDDTLRGGGGDDVCRGGGGDDIKRRC
jgi:RTX calcium-binding nonapeptide repeat (4 copies)